MKKNILYKDHLVRKFLGQNFLNDKIVIDKIIAAINPQKLQKMVEIGPGLGSLTKPIAEIIGIDNLIVIELDKNLAIRLKNDIFFGKNLTIYQQNAMTINFKKLSEKVGQKLHVFGNLPYNISTQLIFYLFKYTDFIADMLFMLQKEVVNRLVAEPNSKTYGKLSVIAQYHCQVIKVLDIDISPTSFYPQPKVNSAVVRLVPYTTLPNPVNKLPILSQIITEAFNQRRKTISNSLSKYFSSNALIKLGINPAMRAENISLAQYCNMANSVK